MRLWPARRSSPPPPLGADELALAADLLDQSLSGVLEADDRIVRGGTLAFRGRLLTEPARALDLLVQRFGALGYTPLLRPDGDAVVVHALPEISTHQRQRVGLSVTLFLVTCVTTLVAGTFYVGSPTFDALRGDARTALLAGIPFATTLLAILATHEFGHYFTARYYKAAVSLPYFIPAPPPLPFGTLGALIRMSSPVRDRNSLFDIAAAGPLAGLLVTVPAMVVGLAWSRVVPHFPGEAFGDSLLTRILLHLRFGDVPDGMRVLTHPMADAAWVGFLVTALNLFPVGQLDGGRIAYALFGRNHRRIGMATFAMLLSLGIVTWSPNWFVWAALIYFLVGFRHSPPLDDVTPLTRWRRAIGFGCLVLLVLLVPPVPLRFE